MTNGWESYKSGGNQVSTPMLEDLNVGRLTFFLALRGPISGLLTPYHTYSVDLFAGLLALLPVLVQPTSTNVIT